MCHDQWNNIFAPTAKMTKNKIESLPRNERSDREDTNVEI